MLVRWNNVSTKFTHYCFQETLKSLNHALISVACYMVVFDKYLNKQLVKIDSK